MNGGSGETADFTAFDPANGGRFPAAAALRTAARAPDGAAVALVWYDTLDDWATLPGREPAMWRPQQSVCAALLAELPGRIRLVQFDTPAYSSWLIGRTDSEAMRSQWAAGVDC